MIQRAARERWNPDSVLLLALMATSGVGQIAVGAEPGSVEALAPRWIALAWAVIFAAAAIVTLAGVLWRDETSGMLLEASGRIALAPTTLAYVVALVASGAAMRGLLLVSILLAIVLGSAWRLWQIVDHFRAARHDLDQLTDERGESGGA